MKFRWTIKELEEVTNKKLLETLISERKCGLSSTYSPLYRRLIEAEKWLETVED